MSQYSQTKKDSNNNNYNTFAYVCFEWDWAAQ